MITRLREGLNWRWRMLRRCGFLVRTFRNGLQLASRYRRKLPNGRAVCWDGTVFRHPANRGGLVETIIEIWFDQVYTGSFCHLRAGDVVIDAGANVGLFSVWLAQRHRSCRVVAFEPFEENYRLLCENIHSAKTVAVEAHRAGLGGTSGHEHITATGVRSLDHRLEVDGPGDTVPVYSFADTLKLTGAERIALFKIDIEGSEYPLFESATTADIARVDCFAVEYHEHIHPGTLELLRTRLAPTHEVFVRPDPLPGYGMLYATIRRASR